MQPVTHVSPFRAQFDSQVSQLNAQREAQKKAMLSRYGAMRSLYITARLLEVYFMKTRPNGFISFGDQHLYHQIDRMKMKNAVKEKKEDEEDTMMSMFGDFSRSQVEDIGQCCPTLYHDCHLY